MDTSLVLSVIGLMLALLSFFISPDDVRNKINKSILSSRQKRIESLIVNYRITKNFRVSPYALNLYIFRAIATALIQLTLLVTAIGLNIIFSFGVNSISPVTIIIVVISLSFQAILTIRTLNIVFSLSNNALYLDKFKEETIKKLIKLSGNPEKLDEEESDAIGG